MLHNISAGDKARKKSELRLALQENPTIPDLSQKSVIEIEQWVDSNITSIRDIKAVLAQLLVAMRVITADDA